MGTFPFPYMSAPTKLVSSLDLPSEGWRDSTRIIKRQPSDMMVPPSHGRDEQQPHLRPEVVTKAPGDEERVGFTPRSAQLPLLTTSQPPLGPTVPEAESQQPASIATSSTQLPPLQFEQPPIPPPSYGQPHYAHNQLPPILPPTTQPNTFYPPIQQATTSLSFNLYAPPTASAPASAALIAPVTTISQAKKKKGQHGEGVDTTPNTNFGGRRGTKRSKQHKRARTGCAVCRKRKLKVQLDAPHHYCNL
jgi:hypothetical protein